VFSDPPGSPDRLKQITEKKMETKTNDVALIETANANRKNEKGVTTVEYAVMLVLVAIAVLNFGTGIAGSVTGVFSTLITKL
jgi:Flp pilus assembly pilin Flp